MWASCGPSAAAPAAPVARPLRGFQTARAAAASSPPRTGILSLASIEDSLQDQPGETNHRLTEPHGSVTTRSAMMVRIDWDRKGSLRPANDSARLRIAGRSRLLQFAQQPQRHVERQVVLAVGVEPAAGVFDQD